MFPIQIITLFSASLSPAVNEGKETRSQTAQNESFRTASRRLGHVLADSPRIAQNKAASQIAKARPDLDVKKLMKKVEALKKHELPKYTCYSYPIDSADIVLKNLKKKKVPIFAYGSLLNSDSAAKSLSENAMAGYQTALIFGYSRTFDRHVPGTKAWGEKERENDTGMLNLLETDEVSNGVIFEATKKDLANLLKREEGYDLVPVVVLPICPDCDEPFIAYTFIASTKSREGVHYTHDQINPVPGYAAASQKGAAQWGKSYEELWIDSTYLSDRKTPFSEWLKDPSIDMNQKD